MCVYIYICIYMCMHIDIGHQGALARAALRRGWPGPAGCPGTLDAVPFTLNPLPCTLHPVP